MPISRLEELFPAELEQRIATRPLIILPFGTIEWHSHHLPLGLDSLKAQTLCEGIAERGDAVLGPLTSWAVGGVPFPYTLRFDLDLIETLMVRVFEQMAVLGFRVVLALTGHYGLEQTLAIKRASLRVMRAYTITVWAAGDFEADPRGNASADVGASTGQAIVYRWAALGERLLTNTSAVQRMQYLEALAAGVRVMDKLLAERSVKSRSQVPSLTTTAYLDHLSALYAGDYLTAQVRAEAKLIDLYA